MHLPSFEIEIILEIFSVLFLPFISDSFVSYPSFSNIAFFLPAFVYLFANPKEKCFYEPLLWLSSFPFAILCIGFGRDSALFHEMYMVCFYNAALALSLKFSFFSYLLKGLQTGSVPLELHVTIMNAFIEITKNSFTFIEVVLISTGLSSVAYATFLNEAGPLVSVLAGVLLVSVPSLVLLNSCLLKTCSRCKLTKEKSSLLVYAASTFVVIFVSRFWVSKRIQQKPEYWVFAQIFLSPYSKKRITILIWWVLCLSCYIGFVVCSHNGSFFRYYFGTKGELLNFRRKTYHALIVFMFLPTYCTDPYFVHLAFSGVLFLFLFIEGIRVLRLEPFGEMIHKFLWQYTDNRDHRGPLIISHIYLLIGCAIPVWFSHALRGPVASAELLVGVLCLGCGDSMASIIGKKYGRFRIRRTKKTLEGTFAFSASVFMVLQLAQRLHICPHVSLKNTLAMSVFTAMLEGVSLENDNLILPMYMWVLYRALENT
ncbi:dolichol kinase [Schizosaccharomyces cryophilus OY26]|uniref:dolichol kinase n=1 Tax=Schizosaccharomyces cryophilus (strain OY26 / ATCC MYA-4695 / CBS 11777 / NBRC 106824 / NRRL Y48691) TaxID=653667 RepID=S9X7N9_SCHCR|nr:dolichol kinase [Schizosaccharomyces cryophilus OY26]EPY49806.1 dolichol kinase [Schizosaccharomyces cryophilus OY26]